MKNELKDVFYNEVINSNICPVDFENKYSIFQSYQKMVLEILYEVHRICEKNKINYQIAYGTLLGLIRDKGQILWDYDEDIFIPYNEKAKLIKALDKDLDKKYYYYCIENNDNCRHMIMRITPKGYNSEIVHLDVFYLIGTPKNSDERLSFLRRVSEISYIRFYKKVNIRKKSRGHLKTFIKLSLYKIKYLFVNMDKLMKEYEELCNKYPLYESTYAASASVGAVSTIYKVDDIKKTILLKDLNGKELRVPSGYDNVLKSSYGDYTKCFSLEKRIAEFEYHIDLIMKYAKVEKK